MSLVLTSPSESSESILESINLARISTGIQGVFNDVVPLLSPENLLDPPILDELRRHMMKFGLAAGYEHMGVMQAASGTQTAALLVTTWNDKSPNDRLVSMVNISEALLLAELNIADARNGLCEVKVALETLFGDFVAQHGSDLVIKIASKKADGHLNIENVSLQTLETRVMRNLEDAESTTSAFHSWLKQLQHWLQSFLQDKNASLTESLEDTPFWSQHSLQKWQILRTQMNETYRELFNIRDTYPSWFSDSQSEMDEDKNSRQHTLQLPKPLITIPADPDPEIKRRYTPIPHRAFYERMGTRNISRYCAVKLESVNHIGKGVSIKLRFTADADEEEPLHAINILCQYSALQSTTSPVLKQHTPGTALDLQNDDVRPPGCRTSLKVITSSPGTLEWRFSPFRFWRRNTTKELPLSFAFSLDLEHSSDISLNIEVSVYRCDWLILKRLQNRHSADITIRALTPPEAEPDPATNTALIKPVISRQ